MADLLARLREAWPELRKGGVGHNPVMDVWLVGPVDAPRLVTSVRRPRAAIITFPAAE